MRDLAVVILNYNTRDLLDECLASLRAQSGLDFITCVVDNASPDGSADRVAAKYPEVELIRNPVNNGYAAGNNLGLRHFGFPDHGDARYLMLLNPDTLVPAGALAGMAAFADANPDVGVVGPKLVLMDGTLDKACRRSFPTPEVSFYRLVGLSKLFPRSRRFGRYNMTYLGVDEQADVDSVVGACMLVRADAIRQAGLLDELFFMYGEDLDWCLRIKQAGDRQAGDRQTGDRQTGDRQTGDRQTGDRQTGDRKAGDRKASDRQTSDRQTGDRKGRPYRVVYYPAVTVHHVKRAASRRSPKAQYEFDRAMWLFYRKHYRATAPFYLDWLIKLGLAVRGGPKLAREVFSGR